MTPKVNQLIRQHVDRRILIQLRIFTIIFLVMVGVVVADLLRNKLSLNLALVGILIGIVLGGVRSRMYCFSWDEQAMKVVARIDLIGGIILALYLAFMVGRNWLFEYWLQATTIAAFGLAVSAGTMFGRVLGTSRGVQKILQAVGVFKPQVETDEIE